MNDSPQPQKEFTWQALVQTPWLPFVIVGIFLLMYFYAPYLVITATISLLITGTLIYLKSTGRLKGERFGFILNFNGAAAIFIVIFLLLTGFLREFNPPAPPTDFSITIYFKEKLGDHTILVRLPGQADLLVGGKKTAQLSDGQVVFANIPSQYLGEEISEKKFDVLINGYVRHGFMKKDNETLRFEHKGEYYYLMEQDFTAPIDEKSATEPRIHEQNHASQATEKPQPEVVASFTLDLLRH